MMTRIKLLEMMNEILSMWAALHAKTRRFKNRPQPLVDYSESAEWEELEEFEEDLHLELNFKPELISACTLSPPSSEKCSSG